MDIRSWLRGLGLGQYEAAFRENEVDNTVLLTLTAEDLKDLGVNLVGHRRKLLDAAVLRAGGGREGASDQRSRHPKGPHLIAYFGENRLNWYGLPIGPRSPAQCPLSCRTSGQRVHLTTSLSGTHRP